ncbi:response regulator transcription factor [Streptomyces sp. NPDC059506]|uniref:response regulator transcription factor n=1 Tax=Streptomyces sp. NPDC059506 TaxID=3347751 RepID=UPI0036CDAF50
MRLLLVEDDEHVAAALRAVLGRHGIAVTHARNGEEALQALLPDGGDPHRVVLLDLGLPDQDGFAVCSRIRRVSRVPVIMVTARADVRSRIHGLNLGAGGARGDAPPTPAPPPPPPPAGPPPPPPPHPARGADRARIHGLNRGADDYVVKPYDTGELLARIHAVSRRSSEDTQETPLPNPPGHAGAPSGTAVLAPVVLGPVTLEQAGRRVEVNGVGVALTRKEFDLLALLAKRPGVVFRREQIISEVWQTSWEGTGRTLEVHVASLRSKLKLPALIETVRGVGYRLVPPAD